MSEKHNTRDGDRTNKNPHIEGFFYVFVIWNDERQAKSVPVVVICIII
jgi:hypothetical protein